MTNEPVKKDTNPKDAIGSSKPGLSAIPCPVLFEIGQAMTEGAAKYRRHNYRVAGVRASIYYDACMRHMMRYWEGEDIDPDSGLPHVSKALACLVILRDAEMQSMLYDDRPPKSADWLPRIEASTKAMLARFPNPQQPFTDQNKDKP